NRLFTESGPPCSCSSSPAIVARDEIQRIGSPARTRRLPLGKREGLDPLLRQSWPSTSDSCRLPWRERSPDRDVPCNLESGRSETKIRNHDYAAIFIGYRSHRGA